jgi:uncharacterized ParB-like nuclease family protein
MLQAKKWRLISKKSVSLVSQSFKVGRVGPVDVTGRRRRMSTSRLRACFGGAGVTRDKRQRQTQVEKRVRWLRWAQMGANGWDVWTVVDCGGDLRQ